MVIDGEKVDMIRQVGDGKLSESESLATHRNSLQTLSKGASATCALMSVDVTCLWTTRQTVYRYAQAFGYRRRELITGLDTERGEPGIGCQGKSQLDTTARAHTNTHNGGGAVRSSDEGMRWSGFSGQDPSLTFQAGHRP